MESPMTCKLLSDFFLIARSTHGQKRAEGALQRPEYQIRLEGRRAGLGQGTDRHSHEKGGQSAFPQRASDSFGGGG